GVEAAGATPDRLFSWYVGIQGTNQSYLTLDDSNGNGQAYDGSGPNGIFSSYYNPIAGVFNQFSNGPYSTCTATGPPKGAATFNVGVALPVCNAYAPWAGSGFLSLAFRIADRENVVNFHFGVPHRNDAGKDDVQLLYYNFAFHEQYGGAISFQGGLPYLNQALTGWGGPTGYAAALFGLNNYNGEFGPNSNLCGYNSILFGPSACATTGGSPLRYDDTHIFAPGTAFGQDAATAQSIVYTAPSTGNHGFQSGIPTTNLDALWNDASVIKLQYQKNFGSSAFVRLMGYSFYTDWLQSSANFAGQFVTGYGYISTGADYPAPDYELDTHTRGLQFEAADQLNPQSLLTFTGNYTTANVIRWNNQWYAAPSGVTNLLNGSGQCFNGLTATQGTTVLVQGGAPNSCLSAYTAGTYGSPTQVPLTTGVCSVSGVTCTPYVPTAGQKYLVTVPQGYGTLNTVVPQFASFALQDEWRPTDKWDINAGVRFESYVYQLGNTDSAEYNFWFNQAANAYCYDPITGQPVLTPTPPGSSPSLAGPVVLPNQPGLGEKAGLCYNTNGTPYIAPSGKQALHPNGQDGSMLYTNIGPSGFSHPFWSPRIGGTYTFSPNSVLRFNYGIYTQPTQTAFEQYLNASGLGAAKFDFTHFWGLGFTNTTHNNPVQFSNNYDLSFEHHLRGTDWTFKLSPFYRYTQNQLVTVSIGNNFSSAINAATQRTLGVELAVQKGDPTRNGLSGQLSYTYTNAKIRYSTLANGSNTIDTINSYITAFNKLTKAGGGSPYYCTDGLGANGTNGPSATPNCPTGSVPIANPYYTTSLQGTLDRNGWYDTYANNPPYSSPDAVTSAALSPNVFAGFLNYKHDKFTATLNGILNQGTTYGSPLVVLGVDPRTCLANQSAIAGIGSAYKYDANYQACNASNFVASGNLAIPNPQTGTFDGLGQYREPWQLNLGMQFGYDVSPKIHVTATLANIGNWCFGGSTANWTTAYKPNTIVCAYAPNGSAYIGAQPGAGFFYGASGHDPANGTAGYPAVFNQPYQPLYNSIPFMAYFQAQIKL
ncbi:MAG: TonB-dependent receptor, partial [Candidatus Eremiobacteraeota bacterium]|nr:TonB-dependent receptor [Candidatus Eremiobacteraeota bacterium]